MSRAIFSEHIVVSKEHIDALNHVNNVTYVQWIQDIAGAHWLSQAPKSVHESIYWVVKKHVIEYKLPCFFGENLLVKTQTPVDFHGPLWDRYVWIYKPDGKLAVEATSTWCLMDRLKNRPLRITPEIHQVFIEVNP